MLSGQLPSVDDAIPKYCLGHGQQFGGIPCSYYDDGSEACTLLKNGPILSVFNERCLKPEIIVYTEYWYWTHKFSEFQGECIDLDIFLRGKKNPEGKIVKKGFLNHHLSQPRLPDLYRYLLRSIWNEIMQTLLKSRLTRRRNECGSCEHVQRPTPGPCLLPSIADPVTGDSIVNPACMQIRKFHDPACNGYAPWPPKAVSFNPDSESIFRTGVTMNEEKRLIGLVDILRKTEQLIERSTGQESGARKRMNQTQLEYWCKLYRAFLRGSASAKHAVAQILDQETTNPWEREALRVSIRRSLDAIKEFCIQRQKMSGNRGNGTVDKQPN